MLAKLAAARGVFGFLVGYCVACPARSSRVGWMFGFQERVCLVFRFRLLEGASKFRSPDR
jgi:hypothetical protein